MVNPAQRRRRAQRLRLGRLLSSRWLSKEPAVERAPVHIWTEVEEDRCDKAHAGPRAEQLQPGRGVEEQDRVHAGRVEGVWPRRRPAPRRLHQDGRRVFSTYCAQVQGRAQRLGRLLQSRWLSQDSRARTHARHDQQDAGPAVRPARQDWRARLCSNRPHLLRGWLADGGAGRVAALVVKACLGTPGVFVTPRRLASRPAVSRGAQRPRAGDCRYAAGSVTPRTARDAECKRRARRASLAG